MFHKSPKTIVHFTHVSTYSLQTIISGEVFFRDETKLDVISDTYFCTST